MPTLLELQRTIEQSMLHHLDGDLSAYVIADGLDGGARLGIYRNTCTSVLATALTLSFPAVRYLVGAEFFEGAARLFAAEAPPHSALLDEYGADFPEFLAQLPQAVSLPYLADVARLEWQVNIVLHAADAQPLDVARLVQLDEAELAHWRFAPHPAAKLLRCDFPADAIWHAVLERDDSAMTAIDLADGPVWLLVQRVESGVALVRLSECQWRFTAVLFSGQPLHAALEDAPCADAQAVLAAHLRRGCFINIGLTDTASKLSFRRIRS
ncbi:DNA-binding domain-containing protein [Collimonas antrihumi]|uniref:HvfC/BufC N-terminal domain-containing protein n=1 Tax=Collimonas antrihumi TaxID=1940615 RepID=UPI001B8CB9EC|nr:DNA-binding domain-containing protein [Collimonas antrihumi]